MADALSDPVATNLANPSGPAAAAILLMLLDEGDAASVLRELNQDEVRLLAKAMFGAADADDATVEAALDIFVGRSRNVSALAVGADARIRSVMTEALGNIRADNLLAAVAPQASAASLDMLRWLEPDQITALIRAEHPQVGALILSALVPDVAAKAIAPLDERTQTDLMLRTAELSSVGSDALADLEAILIEATSAQSADPRQPVGGPADVAQIIKQMPKPLSERAIRALRKQNRKIAQIIEDEMFVFENLRELDKKTLGNVLRAVDAKLLSVALKGVDEPMVNLCLATMSKRAAETIRDEMADLTMVKRSDVDEAQRAIMLIVRQMAAAGDIVINAGGEEYV